MTGHVRISLAAWVATILGAIVLVPVFSGPFLFVSAFICALVTGTGILLQSWRTPRYVVPVVQLAVLVELISVLFLRSTLRFGVLPWKETVIAFNDQLVKAMDAINRFSAPLPPESYLTVFAASVIAATGLLIHFIAMQLQQAAWAGLLLLMMYTVPAATVHGGLPAILFVPPALGYIVLLSAEGRSRLSRWGRRISGVTQLDGTEPVEASALGQAGRRIGLSVVALAALLPALLPALPEGVVGNGLAGGGGGGGGGAFISPSDTMLDMGRNLKRGDNQQALSYTGEPTYLRLTTLDQFNGREWRVSARSEGTKIDGALSTPPGLTKDLSSIEKKKYRVEVTRNLRSAFVPVPYPLASISLDDKWRYDPTALDVVSANGRVVAGLKYNLTSYDLKPTEGELRNSVASGAPDQYTSDVPQRTSSRIRELTERITAAAEGNRYEQAVLLQQYFRDSTRFTYSLETDGQSGMRAIESFLFDTQTGYCEQFSTAMTLMARILGIPARVGVGFLPGQQNDGKYVVRMHDMHAWPELYFQGVGWVRFEPTPAQRVSSPPEWTFSTGEQDPSVGATTAPPTAPTTAATEDPGAINPDRNLPDEGGAAIGDTGNWWSNGGVRWVAGGAGVLLVLCLPWLGRTLVRRRRFLRPPGRPSAEGLWAEIRDTARDLGLDWSDTATPRQLGSWLQDQLPSERRQAVTTMARGVEAVRYAGQNSSAVDLREPADTVRRALWSTQKLPRRLRALLLPPSYRWYLSRGSAEASDLLDDFDLLLARLRSALLPRRPQSRSPKSP
jgi:transglutaminase-like putative cysteine protease